MCIGNLDRKFLAREFEANAVRAHELKQELKVDQNQARPRSEARSTHVLAALRDWLAQRNTKHV